MDARILSVSLLLTTGCQVLDVDSSTVPDSHPWMQIAEFDSGIRGVRDVEFSPDETRILLTAGSVKSCNMRTSSIGSVTETSLWVLKKPFASSLRTWAYAPDSGWSIARFDSTGDHVLIGTDDGLLIHDVESSEMRRIDPPLAGESVSVGFIATDGRHVVWRNEAETLAIQNPQSGEVVALATESELTNDETKYRHDREWLLQAAATRDDSQPIAPYAFWGEQLRLWPGQNFGLMTATVSLDGSKLAGRESHFSVQDEVQHYFVRIRNSATGTTTAQFKLGETTPRTMTFSPDGRLLAVGSEGTDDTGEVRIYDTQQEVLLAMWQIEGTWGVTGLGFSRDGETLAVGCADGRVILYRRNQVDAVE